MSRWSQSVKLSWDTSGHGEEVIWWPIEDLAAKTSVQKCGCLLLTFWSLSSSWLLTSAHHISSFTTSPFFSKCPLDNTPSIWRWRTTHTCTVKQLQGKKLFSVSCGSKTPLFFVLFFIRMNICSLFLYQGVHSLLFIMSIKAGLRGPGKGSCMRIRVWRFSYRAEANLTKTHMHANVNPHQSWWGTHGI